jgi:hypothetical protein
VLSEDQEEEAAEEWDVIKTPPYSSGESDNDEDDS